MTAPISNGPATTRLHHYAGHYYARSLIPLGRLTDAAGIRAILRLIDISVPIICHSFTCRSRACRELRKTFDKFGQEKLTTDAHLCRRSSKIGQMCVMVAQHS